MSFFESLSEISAAVFGFLYGNIGWILASAGAAGAVVLGVLIYGKIRKYQIKHLKYERSFSLDGVFEGEGAEFYETVTNMTPLPMLFVDIESFIYSQLRLEGYEGVRDGDMQYFVSRFHLAPYAKIRRRRRITAQKRGVYTLGTAQIYVHKTPIYLQSSAMLYVYPRYRTVGEYSSPLNFLQGDVITRRRLIADPFSASGIRDYAPGDPFGLINFKATARACGRIKVNEREYCSGRIFMIYINFQPPPEFSIPGDKYEAMMEDTLSFAASVVRKALSDGYRVGFGANCKKTSGEMITNYLPASGHGVLEAILREMAGMRFDCGISFSAMLSANIPHIRDSEVYIMTPYMTSDIDTHIKAYKRRNNNVVIFSLT